MNKKLILKERARLMAQEVVREDSHTNSIEIIEFQIEKEKYGVELKFVSKVCSIEYLTFLPGLPNFMPGIINIHGEIIPIVDLKKFFGLQETAVSILRQTIILRYGRLVIGILADEVLGVHKVLESELQTSLPALIGTGSDYLKAVTLSQVAILDPEKFSKDKRIIIQKIA